MIGFEIRTVVVGHRVVEVELETDDRPRSVGLSVRVDGARRWPSEEPGWRDVACGVYGDVFVWSARRLVVVPLDPGAEVHAIDCDEDIITVFQVEHRWLLVCETSLRLVSDGGELSRLDLPDVINETRWDRDQLLIGCDDGTSVRVSVGSGGLKVLPAAS